MTLENNTDIKYTNSREEIKVYTHNINRQPKFTNDSEAIMNDNTIRHYIELFVNANKN